MLFGGKGRHVYHLLSDSSKIELQPCDFLTHLKLKSEMPVVRTKMFYLHF